MSTELSKRRGSNEQKVPEQKKDTDRSDRKVTCTIDKTRVSSCKKKCTEKSRGTAASFWSHLVDELGVVSRSDEHDGHVV